MPELFKILLSLHISLGVATIIAFGYLWALLKNPETKNMYLKLISLGGFLTLFASWITGGYYYVHYYGKFVKPAILSGSQPFAHKLIMESKEHIFIIIPFLSLVLLSLILKIDFSSANINKNFKITVTRMAMLVEIFLVLMAIMGFIISGAY